ncbi:hypothetical protein [Algibacter sp. R77976]|uniref:hypothetical protein n=1 Tax=Algibacter sp. R77976 TaxID=3093873 RepID=UPI0037C987AC
MNVVNTHKRIINQPQVKVAMLLETLATKADCVWPNDKWPPIRFKNGLKVGEKGGHGIIRYSVEEYILGKLIVFRFLQPKGFNGIHKFEVKEINSTSTEVTHSIIMNTIGVKATLQWLIAIRWLHDALIENAFDTIENNFLEVKKHTKWSYWVSFWRFILTRIR